MLSRTCLCVFLVLSASPALGGTVSPTGRPHHDLFDVASVSPDGFVAVGERGAIFRTGDGGRTWERVDAGTGRALAAVCFPDDSNGWTVGQAGTILHSPDSGKTWVPQPSGSGAYLLDVDFFDASHGTAVGENCTVLATADGGRSWTRTGFRDPDGWEEGINLYTVAMTGPDRACIAGDQGRIFRTGDSGRTWHEASSPLYDAERMDGAVIYSMARDSGVMYAVGIDGVFVMSRDQGRTWARRRTGYEGPELYGIDVAGGRGVAVGSGGLLLRTLDGGANWERIEVPAETERIWLNGVSLGRTDGLIVGRNGACGRLSNGIVTW